MLETNCEENNQNRILKSALAKKVDNLFGEVIDIACAHYRLQKKAEIHKTSEPMQLIRYLGQGRYVTGYSKHAQPDYYGTLSDGRSVVFMARSIDSNRVEQKLLTIHQTIMLNSHAMMGAECFILVAANNGLFYRMPLETWLLMNQVKHSYILIKSLNPYIITYQEGLLSFLD